mmetsp:Transcript_66270/g.158533  ORF Transcript_66270/g.158533 Transcript_66270/m.158533 type:complete len:102 (+) Transcript_66270:102-407(+)
MFGAVCCGMNFESALTKIHADTTAGFPRSMSSIVRVVANDSIMAIMKTERLSHGFHSPCNGIRHSDACGIARFVLDVAQSNSALSSQKKFIGGMAMRHRIA